MFWQKITAWISKQRSANHLDHALVKKTRTVSLPRWSQCKYFLELLSPLEKRLFWGGLVAAVIGVVGLSGVFLNHHIATVAKDGGTYTEAMVGEPKYINPLFADANDVDNDLAHLVYAGLFRYSPNGTLEPHLASGYTLSDDKKTYTVTLRDGLVWSDGEPLTANDIVFTFETIANSDVGSPLYTAFQGVSIQKIDDQKVSFTLKEPFGPFVQSLSVGLIPEHIWGTVAPANLRLAKTNLQPIGAGPWQFSKLFKDETGRIDSFELTRNDRFFGDKPHLKKLVFKFFENYTGALDALKSQNIDAVSFVPLGLISKINDKKFTLSALHLPQYTALFFNQAEKPALKDAATREALATAVDKQSLIANALGGYGKVISSPFVFTTTTDKFDIDKANELLDKNWQRIEPEEYFKIELDARLAAKKSEIDTFHKANSSTPDKIAEYDKEIRETLTHAIRGNMEANQTFYRRDKNKNTLSITITTVNMPEYTKVAEGIRAMWQKIGVETNVQTIESRDVVREILKNHNYEVLVYGEIMGADPDPFPFWHSSQIDYPGLNVALYSSRTADTMLEEARGTADPVKRLSLYNDFAKQLQKDRPAVFLFSPEHIMAVSKAIKGVGEQTINSPSDRYAALSDWYRNTKWVWKP